MARPSRCAIAYPILAAWLAASADVVAEDNPRVPLVLALEDQANLIWSDLPESAGDRRVTRLGHTPASCATEALRRAKDAVGRGQAGRAALRQLALTAQVSRQVLTSSGPGAAGGAALLAEYAASPDKQELAQAWQPLLDASCPGAVGYQMQAPSDPDRPPRLHMLIEGGCGCGGPGPADARPRRFRIAGSAELEPRTRNAQGKGLRWGWDAGEPAYLVLASCAPCRDNDSAAAETAAADAGGCGQACAALTQAAAGWRREAAALDAEAATLRGNVAALETDLSSQRRELDAARQARRQPRSVRERIAALQEKLNATQGGLERGRATAAELEDRLGALRRADEEATLAGRRCDAQCAPAPAPADASVKAAGGGPGATTLILSGLAAGGVAVGIAVATGGEGDAGPAESRYVLSGDARPGAPFTLDDFARIFVDGQLVGEFFGCRTFTGPCAPSEPVAFRSLPGHSLTVEAFDYGGGPYALGPVYLHKDGRLMNLLIPRVDCDAPPVPCPTPGGSGPVLFFRQTFALP